MKKLLLLLTLLSALVPSPAEARPGALDDYVRAGFDAAFLDHRSGTWASSLDEEGAR